MHTVSDVLWLGDYNEDNMGSFIVTSGNTMPDESVYDELPSTTPAPQWGESRSACWCSFTQCLEPGRH